MKKNKRPTGAQAASSAGMFVLFLIMAAVTLLPFICIVFASLRPGTEIMRQGINLTIDKETASINNYINLFSEDTPYFTWFLNSLKITVIQTALTLIISAFVAYGFAMYDFKGKNLLFTCVLLLMMIPLEVLMLPLYRLIIKLRLIDSIWGIILPSVAAPLPIFFFRQYLSGISREYLDAARIDGASEYGIFFRVVLPLMKPSFAAMGIFVGMNSWNNFLWPMLVLSSANKLTLPIGLNSLITPYGNNYNVLIAGAVFSIIPIVILYLIFQKFFIAGMTAGGVKE